MYYIKLTIYISSVSYNFAKGLQNTSAVKLFQFRSSLVAPP